MQPADPLFLFSYQQKKRPDFLLLIRSFSLSFYLLTFTVKPFLLCRFLCTDIQVPGSGTFPHDSNQLFGAQRIADTKACHRIIFGKGAENQKSVFPDALSYNLDDTAAVRLGGNFMYASSITSSTSSGRVSANASSSPIGTYVPVGLFGLEITTIFVFSPIFSFMAGRLNFAPRLPVRRPAHRHLNTPCRQMSRRSARKTAPHLHRPEGVSPIISIIALIRLLSVHFLLLLRTAPLPSVSAVLLQNQDKNGYLP